MPLQEEPPTPDLFHGYPNKFSWLTSFSGKTILILGDFLKNTFSHALSMLSSFTRKFEVGCFSSTTQLLSFRASRYLVNPRPNTLPHVLDQTRRNARGHRLQISMQESPVHYQSKQQNLFETLHEAYRKFQTRKGLCLHPVSLQMFG